MGTSDAKWVMDYISESDVVMRTFADDARAAETLLAIANKIAISLAEGQKLLVAGNGGSAGDAQHIAGEFISRLFFDRGPLAAIALTTDTSVLTAIGNDYSYERVFERQVLGVGRKGDVLLGISTSGTSPNIIRALEAAREVGIVTLGFTGSRAGPMDELCSHVFHAPSEKTSMIQQIHIVAAHIICGIAERRLCRSPAA